MALARASTAEISLLVRFPTLDFERIRDMRGLGVQRHIKAWNIDSLELDDFDDGWYSPNKDFWSEVTPDAIEALLSFWFDICELVKLQMGGPQTLGQIRQETMAEAAELSREYCIANNMKLLFRYVDDHPKCSLAGKVKLVMFPNGYGEIEKARARQLLCETIRKTLSEEMIFVMIKSVHHFCGMFKKQNIDQKPVSIKPGEWNPKQEYRPENYYHPFGNSQAALNGLRKAAVVILLDHTYRGPISVPYQDNLGRTGSNVHWGLLYKTLKKTYAYSPDDHYPKFLGFFYRSVRLAAQLEEYPEKEIRLVKSRSTDVQRLMSITRSARAYYGIA